jgi:predicted kinase
MIEVLVGTIASGKSTWCLEKAKEGWLIINDDAIVSMLHGGLYAYRQDLKILYKSIETHIFHMCVALGYDIIIDKGLNLTVASRKRWISLAQSVDEQIRARVFPFSTAKVHAERRMKHESRSFSYEKWLNIAQEHIKRFEWPTINEGFCSIEYNKPLEWQAQEQKDKEEAYEKARDA